MTVIETHSPVVFAARMQERTLIASIRGDIDLHKSPAVRGVVLGAINEHGPKNIVLNLAEVPYMDSSAIAVMVEALRKIRGSGGKMFLTNLQPRVKGLLEIARLNTLFMLVDSEEDALKQLT